MLKRGYDIISWIWLVVLILLFLGSFYISTSTINNLSQKGLDGINDGKPLEFGDLKRNIEEAKPSLISINIIKWALYLLGGIYSIIIFILCFRLKAGTLEKSIVLIGGILTYGGLALLTYFFDIRKKFNQKVGQDDEREKSKEKNKMVRIAIIFAIVSFLLLLIFMLLVFMGIYP